MNTTYFSALSRFFQTYPIPVVIVDLETTGGNLTDDRITEIAFLHFKQGQITSVQQLINPQKTIGSFVENLTGINNEMVANQPTFEQFAPKILPLLRGSLLIAHNSKFDYSFLKHEFERIGVAFAAPTLCSVQLSRKLYPEFYKHGLDEIAQRHQLSFNGNRHRAMSDVLILSEFLQLALREKGEIAWQQATRQLLHPTILPSHLPTYIAEKVYALPDTHAVSIWKNAAHEIVAIHTHKHAFQEITLLFKQAKYAQIHQFECIKTIGALHSEITRAEIMLRHHLLPNDEIIRHTIVVQDVSGCLKTRVRPLKAGFYPAPPHGLFQHPKAAKRALNEWAKKFNLCPTLLGILPNELPKNTPCPVSVIGKCSLACENHDLDLHNNAVLAALPYLPCGDWGHQHRINITEHNAITGQSVTHLVDNGAILLPEDRWFIDSSILAIIKQKFKIDRGNIQAA